MMRNRRLGQPLDVVASVGQVREDAEASLVAERLKDGDKRGKRPLARLAWR